MTKAYLGIGVPGSGKSTLLRPLAAELGAVYLASDRIREEVTGSEADISRDNEVWSLLYERVNEWSQRGRPLVVDCTSANFQKRRDLADWVRNGVDWVYGLYFECPLDVALARNSSRERRVPESVIRNMHEQLVAHPPSTQDGFDGIMVVGGARGSRLLL